MQPQGPTSMPPYPQPPYPEDEIDLLELAKKVWDGRKKIIRFLVSFMALGLVFAFLLPVEFSASSTFIPQVASGGPKTGGLSGLASLAGINLGEIGSDQEIPPTLYPRLVQSVKFKKSLIQAKITHPETGKDISYADYYEELYQPGLLASFQKYTLGLPSLVVSDVKWESQVEPLSEYGGLIFVSEKEHIHFERLASQLSVTTNAKEGFVTLAFTMPNAVMAAQMATAAQKLLQDEVIAFRIRNAKEQLAFTEERYQEKKKEFESMQRRLAAFRDRNKNIASATAQSDIQRLEAEFNLAFSVYNEIAKQLEQAKLQVSKDTPVFSDIQSISVPSKKSSPDRPKIILIFTIFGFIIGFFWVITPIIYSQKFKDNLV